MKKVPRTKLLLLAGQDEPTPAEILNRLGLPERFRRYFWDCDFDTVSWRKHKVYVVTRILTHGSPADITWIRMKVGDAWLRKWFIEKQGRELNREQLNLWRALLGVPKEAVDAWLKNDFTRQIWENRLMPKTCSKPMTFGGGVPDGQGETDRNSLVRI